MIRSFNSFSSSLRGGQRCYESGLEVQRAFIDVLKHVSRFDEQRLSAEVQITCFLDLSNLKTRGTLPSPCLQSTFPAKDAVEKSERAPLLIQSSSAAAQ